MIGIKTKREMEASRLMRMAKLTYALKLIFIPDFIKFTSTFLNRGKKRAVFSPMIRKAKA